MNGPFEFYYPFFLLFLKISLFYPYFRGSGVVENEEIFKYEFTTHDLITLVLSTLVGVWYLLKKHWIANNLFGLAFAVNGVELLHLNNVMTGFILLGGLFFYDIFWVFATDVVSTFNSYIFRLCIQGQPLGIDTK